MSIGTSKYASCVGCGFCCFTAPCAAATRLYNIVSGPCPQLRWDDTDQRYFCGLATLPGKIGEGYREELYIGAGCCSGLNSWRNNVICRDEEIVAKNPIPSEFQTFLNSLGRQFVSGDFIYLLLVDFKDKLVRNLGYTEEQARLYIVNANKIIRDNRSSLSEGFMG